MPVQRVGLTAATHTHMALSERDEHRIGSALQAAQFGSEHGHLNSWLAQAKSEGDRWPPLAAGMLDGSYARFEQLQAVLLGFIRRAGPF